MKPPVDAPASSTRRPVDVDAEAVEGGVELLARPGSTKRGGGPTSGRLVGADQARRLVGRRTADE